ncbi:MAG: oleate hydratase, partial [Bacteroidetes bacterium]|nr:oleate hydratase [Bacteroidota bacterium]
MKKCVVIGGGIAGLTSAVYLSKSGINVELIESSNKLGGRAYSFKDTATGSTIDNGQHILMGCYKDTLDFLRLINAEDNLIYQDRLSIPFLNSNSEIFKLEATKLFYPLNLLMGLLNYNALRIEDKISLIVFFIKLAFSDINKLKNLTVEGWLFREKQSENLRKSF